ncbi:MAG: hypothetical protein ACLR23_04260 [Clostridia bacterium]
MWIKYPAPSPHGAEQPAIQNIAIPGCTVVLLSALHRQKSEVFENSVEGSADLALTFEEMLPVLEASGY